MSKRLGFTVFGALFLLVAATATTRAWVDGASRASYVTFNRPVMMPGAELSAGTYIFELAAPHSNLNLVRVSSRDRTKIYLTAFTLIVDRPAGMPEDRTVTLGEARAGAAPPVRTWFPSKTGSGHQFIYSR